MNNRSRFRNSIFTKLLLTIIISGLLVQIAVILFFGYHLLPKLRGPLQTNLQNYCELLAQQIGSPPDTVKANQIAQKYFLAIEYQGNQRQWNCNERILSHYPVRRFFESEIFFIVNHSDGSKFIFRGNFQQFGNPQPWKMIPLLASIMIIMLLAYLIMRYLLQPIKTLEAGVKEVGRGNFDYQIGSNRNDELGNLTRSYNEMSQKIKEMIQARDHLLQNVSHELRSPLTRMRVALEFLKPQKRAASVAADIRTMEYLIQEILETERLKTGFGKLSREQTDIVDLVRTLAESYKKRKPGIKLLSPSKHIMMTIDRERIRMVLKNIIENAYKYSGKNSHAVEVKINDGTKNVRISVSDDGMGIPSEEIPYVFEPFYRADRSRSNRAGGYGLGLSICKTIIQAHDGTISIAHNHPRGTTILIELPL